jgi:hypothetical protein
LGLKTAFSVEKAVDKICRFFPQGEPLEEVGAAATSGMASEYLSHIWRVGAFLHTIHTPYYYYDSHYMLNKWENNNL